MSESFVFRGNRDQFQEWYDAIKIEFNRNGVNRVALNIHKYPPQIVCKYERKKETQTVGKFKRKKGASKKDLHETGEEKLLKVNIGN